MLEFSLLRTTALGNISKRKKARVRHFETTNQRREDYKHKQMKHTLVNQQQTWIINEYEGV